jgi:hypothetical protein
MSSPVRGAPRVRFFVYPSFLSAAFLLGCGETDTVKPVGGVDTPPQPGSKAKKDRMPDVVKDDSLVKNRLR